MAIFVIDLLFLQAKKSSNFFSNGRKVELVDVKPVLQTTDRTGEPFI